MGRLAWYAGVSAALAGGVIVSAFHQRANFYSACVYLAQSNLCLMILINLILFIYGSFMYGLQRLCYGPLRPIEIEQLYEKAWFAITETCLAMTIFREEVGAWFLVMFVALLTGKVWGWIGDGRVEVLEQQPPANPRLFHIRLSVSLGVSVLYDAWLMSYTINTVIRQARPNMMVMFLFEFAVLTTSSFSTGFRYCISLIEASVVKKQTHDRLIERRREVREERAEMIRQREAAAVEGTELSAEAASAPLPDENDVDEMDIEVPGWEAKGQWVLTLDLITDFVKLCIYVLFFFILFTFYGLPIHIMRDLFITARSFVKRLTAFLRYRRATHDMNTRYEDATVEDIQREDTCIICREEMRPWSVTNPLAPQGAPGAIPPAPARPTGPVNERSRPKKLPCGHILHLGCLKSWLERQQVCPTCRRPVVSTGNAPAGAANAANPAAGAPGAQPPAAGQQDGAAPQPPAANGRGRGMRMLNLGPLRVGFGEANIQNAVQGFGPQAGQPNAPNAGPRVYGLELGFPGRRPDAPNQNLQINNEDLPAHLLQIEQHLLQEARNLQLSQQELHYVRLLEAELARLRILQNGAQDGLVANFQTPGITQIPRPVAHAPAQMQRHGLRSATSAIPAGSPDLPPGVVIPEGWSLLPLERLDGRVNAEPAENVEPTPTATTQTDISPMASGSNNTPTQPINQNPDNQSQTSDSSDTHNIHTPASGIADQTSAVPDATTSTAPTTFTSIPSSTNITRPPTLPSWGSSNLFLGSDGRNVSSSSLNAPVTGPSSSSEHITDPEEEGRDKGKAKAASVEDEPDTEAGT